MFSLLKSIDNKQDQTPKRQVSIPGTLMSVLMPGLSAVYLYNGTLIRTSIVQAILEVSPNYVRFETLNSIYTIYFNN